MDVFHHPQDFCLLPPSEEAHTKDNEDEGEEKKASARFGRPKSEQLSSGRPNENSAAGGKMRREDTSTAAAGGGGGSTLGCNCFVEPLFLDVFMGIFNEEYLRRERFLDPTHPLRYCAICWPTGPPGGAAHQSHRGPPAERAGGHSSVFYTGNRRSGAARSTSPSNMSGTHVRASIQSSGVTRDGSFNLSHQQNTTEGGFSTEDMSFSSRSSAVAMLSRRESLQPVSEGLSSNHNHNTSLLDGDGDGSGGGGGELQRASSLQLFMSSASQATPKARMMQTAAEATTSSAPVVGPSSTLGRLQNGMENTTMTTAPALIPQKASLTIPMMVNGFSNSDEGRHASAFSSVDMIPACPGGALPRSTSPSLSKDMLSNHVEAPKINPNNNSSQISTHVVNVRSSGSGRRLTSQEEEEAVHALLMCLTCAKCFCVEHVYEHYEVHSVECFPPVQGSAYPQHSFFIGTPSLPTSLDSASWSAATPPTERMWGLSYPTIRIREVEDKTLDVKQRYRLDNDTRKAIFHPSILPAPRRPERPPGTLTATESVSSSQTSSPSAWFRRSGSHHPVHSSSSAAFSPPCGSPSSRSGGGLHHNGRPLTTGKPFLPSPEVYAATGEHGSWSYLIWCGKCHGRQCQRVSANKFIKTDRRLDLARQLGHLTAFLSYCQLKCLRLDPPRAYCEYFLALERGKGSLGVNRTSHHGRARKISSSNHHPSGRYGGGGGGYAPYPPSSCSSAASRHNSAHHLHCCPHPPHASQNGGGSFTHHPTSVIDVEGFSPFELDDDSCHLNAEDGGDPMTLGDAAGRKLGLGSPSAASRVRIGQRGGGGGYGMEDLDGSSSAADGQHQRGTTRWADGSRQQSMTSSRGRNSMSRSGGLAMSPSSSSLRRHNSSTSGSGGPPSIFRSQEALEVMAASAVAGFPNPSVYCYMNSVLQCVVHCQFFVRWMLECRVAEECPGKLCKSVDQVVTRLRRQTYLEVSKNAIYPYIALVRSTVLKGNALFQEGEQQDAQEFLLAVSNGIAEEFDAENKKEDKTDTKKNTAEKQGILPVNQPRISFEGAQRTCVRCRRCGLVRERTEGFMTLSIPLQSSIQEGLRALLSASKLRGLDQYACENCFYQLSSADQLAHNETACTAQEEEKQRRKEELQAAMDLQKQKQKQQGENEAAERIKKSGESTSTPSNPRIGLPPIHMAQQPHSTGERRQPHHGGSPTRSLNNNDNESRPFFMNTQASGSPKKGVPERRATPVMAPNCVYADADVTTDLTALGGTLALHLLRFHYDAQEQGFIKVTTDVKVDLVVDLSPFIGPAVQRQYARYAVLNQMHDRLCRYLAARKRRRGAERKESLSFLSHQHNPIASATDTTMLDSMGSGSLDRPIAPPTPSSARRKPLSSSTKAGRTRGKDDDDEDDEDEDVQTLLRRRYVCSEPDSLFESVLDGVTASCSTARSTPGSSSGASAYDLNAALSALERRLQLPQGALLSMDFQTVDDNDDGMMVAQWNNRHPHRHSNYGGDDGGWPSTQDERDAPVQVITVPPLPTQAGSPQGATTVPRRRGSAAGAGAGVFCEPCTPLEDRVLPDFESVGEQSQPHYMHRSPFSREPTGRSFSSVSRRNQKNGNLVLSKNKGDGVNGAAEEESVELTGYQLMDDSAGSWGAVGGDADGSLVTPVSAGVVREEAVGAYSNQSPLFHKNRNHNHNNNNDNSKANPQQQQQQQRRFPSQSEEATMGEKRSGRMMAGRTSSSAAGGGGYTTHVGTLTTASFATVQNMGTLNTVQISGFEPVSELPTESYDTIFVQSLSQASPVCSMQFGNSTTSATTTTMSKLRPVSGATAVPLSGNTMNQNTGLTPGSGNPHFYANVPVDQPIVASAHHPSRDSLPTPQSQLAQPPQVQSPRRHYYLHGSRDKDNAGLLVAYASPDGDYTYENGDRSTCSPSAAPQTARPSHGGAAVVMGSSATMGTGDGNSGGGGGMFSSTPPVNHTGGGTTNGRHAFNGMRERSEGATKTTSSARPALLGGVKPPRLNVVETSSPAFSSSSSNATGGRGAANTTAPLGGMTLANSPRCRFGPQATSSLSITSSALPRTANTSSGTLSPSATRRTRRNSSSSSNHPQSQRRGSGGGSGVGPVTAGTSSTAIPPSSSTRKPVAVGDNTTTTTTSALSPSAPSSRHRRNNRMPERTTAAAAAIPRQSTGRSKQKWLRERPVRRWPSLQRELVGVVTHRGTLDRGHYIAYVRELSRPNLWFRCDDEDVELVTYDVVRECGAEVYLAFYE